MAKFAAVFVLVGVLVGAVLSAGPPPAGYFRRYTQKRQAPFGGANSGSCGVTITVGGGNGCNCACPPADAQSPPPAPPPSTDEPEWGHPPAPAEPPAAPVNEAPSDGCGTQNPFCGGKSLPGGGQTSMGDEYCTHRFDCISCGSRNATGCDEGDGNAVRGQCFFQWSSDEFLAKHCQYHPVCNSQCRINRNEWNKEI